MTETSREAVTRCDGIRGVFGETPRRAMDAVPGRGAIFRTLGLSGACTSTLIRHD